MSGKCPARAAEVAHQTHVTARSLRFPHCPWRSPRSGARRPHLRRPATHSAHLVLQTTTISSSNPHQAAASLARRSRPRAAACLVAHLLQARARRALEEDYLGAERRRRSLRRREDRCLEEEQPRAPTPRGPPVACLGRPALRTRPEERACLVKRTHLHLRVVVVVFSVKRPRRRNPPRAPSLAAPPPPNPRPAVASSGLLLRPQTSLRLAPFLGTRRQIPPNPPPGASLGARTISNRRPVARCSEVDSKRPLYSAVPLVQTIPARAATSSGARITTPAAASSARARTTNLHRADPCSGRRKHSSSLHSLRSARARCSAAQTPLGCTQVPSPCLRPSPRHWVCSRTVAAFSRLAALLFRPPARLQTRPLSSRTSQHG
jgi:hypothetical protein